MVLLTDKRTNKIFNRFYYKDALEAENAMTLEMLELEWTEEFLDLLDMKVIVDIGDKNFYMNESKVYDYIRRKISIILTTCVGVVTLLILGIMLGI